ncbi:MAG: hypothetical protein N2484_16570 [Clostridia bacterium]|nr:hypothetical protein [Clostridia bacterium]
MRNNHILIAVGLNRDLAENVPLILAENEEQLQTISSELGRILEGNVCRLANGLVIITAPGR